MPSKLGATNLPALFFTSANFRFSALASEKSTYPTAPLVPVTTWATPALPLPACVSAGQFTVSPAPSVHDDGAAAARYLVKFDVVPDPSERCATVIAVAGSLVPEFKEAMA